jgi:phosphopantetheine adenylyltransferase
MFSLSMTSSAVDSSTQTTPFVDISDACGITALINGATTAPGFTIQVNLTTISTGLWATLTYMTSGASTIYLSSGIATRIAPIHGMLARIATSNVTSTSGTVIWSKEVEL